MSIHAVNGADLYVEQRGQGPALVYVHGGFACLGRALQGAAHPGSAWQEDFTARYTVVSYDRRGFGRSSTPPDGYDIPTQADDLAGLLDVLQLTRVHLFASSAGAPIAVRYAVVHPDRVVSVTIQGSSLAILRPGDGVREPALAAHQVLQLDGPVAAFAARPPGVEIWFESAWGRRQAESDGRLAEYLTEENALIEVAAMLRTSTRTALYALEVRNIHAYEGWDLHHDASALTVPTLVLHGCRDQIFTPSAGRELASSIPTARFSLVEDAGHGPMFTSAVARRDTIAFMQATEQSTERLPVLSPIEREK